MPRRMFDPHFESLGARQAQAGLSDDDIRFLLGLPEERFEEITGPGSHELSRSEAAGIIDLSVTLGRLMTIIEPEAVRDWLWEPNPAYLGEKPAILIAIGDMKLIDEFIEGLLTG